MQWVLDQADRENTNERRTHMEQVKSVNEQKKAVLEKLAALRKEAKNPLDHEAEINKWEQKLQSIGDEAQLANVELQSMLEKQQQNMQMMSDTAKMLHETAMQVIREIER